LGHGGIRRKKVSLPVNKLTYILLLSKSMKLVFSTVHNNFELLETSMNIIFNRLDILDVFTLNKFLIRMQSL